MNTLLSILVFWEDGHTHYQELSRFTSSTYKKQKSASDYCEPYWEHMSSERRIRASRANGALSQGPISDAGKAVSSRNGLRHGILAQTVVLDDEDSELFATLLSTLENELCPGDETDRALIENMAVARWRLMRLWGMEKAGLCHEMEKHQSSALNSPTRAALAFRSLSDESRSLDVLGRYETRYDRQYARALNLLLKRKVLNSKFPHER